VVYVEVPWLSVVVDEGQGVKWVGLHVRRVRVFEVIVGRRSVVTQQGAALCSLHLYHCVKLGSIHTNEVVSVSALAL
jgi:hypothetical protein